MSLFADPYEEVFVCKSTDIYKKKPPGCISYDNKKKRFRAQGPRPEKKHIGFYNKRESALEALNFYHLTGKKMESDRTNRKSGTGNISEKNGRFVARVSAVYLGSYGSYREAIESIVMYTVNGTKPKKKNQYLSV